MEYGRRLIKRYLNRNQRWIAWFIFLLLIYVVIYHTSVVYDWSDPATWNFKRRVLNVDYLEIPHTKVAPILLTCGDFLNPQSTATEQYVSFGRMVLDADPKIDYDCDAIRRRILPPRQVKVKNPFAISRVVYQDYLWLESSLSSTYSTQNMYCYAVDAKSSDNFYNRIKLWEQCFENVIVLEERLAYDSEGHYINYGHYGCTEAMLNRGGEWKYLMWLQNHDIFLKTNEEISDILGSLNGSHSIGHKPAQWKRYNVLTDWSAKAIKLWKNESTKTERQLNAQLVVSQNYNEVMVSRELVEYVFREMNLKNLLDAFEQPYRFATDELFWATLAASPELGLPGFPKEGCPGNDFYILRYNEWEKWYNPPCKSGKSRHGTCVFGMEYLEMFSKLHHIVANKIMPAFDYGFVMCLHELLYNRTYLNQPLPLEAKKIYDRPSQDFC